MFRALALSMLTAALSSAALAQAPAQYRQSTSRGLHLFELGTSAARFRLICDSDGAYPGQKMGAVFPFFPKDRTPARVVFLGSDGSEADFKVDARSGEILEYQADPIQWGKLTALIKRGGTFAMVTKDDSLTFSAVPLPALNCP